MITILGIMSLCKQATDGFDIGDSIWDWANFFSCPSSLNECNDYYDKVMYQFASEIELDGKFDGEWITCCKVSEYIHKHQKQFDKFMNEKNCNDYKPGCYTKRFKYDEDEEWCDLYITTFENLINGNYSESDYEYLYKLLV